MRTPVTLYIILLDGNGNYRDEILHPDCAHIHPVIYSTTRIPVVEGGREYVKINGDWRLVDGKMIYTCTRPKGSKVVENSAEVWHERRAA